MRKLFFPALLLISMNTFAQSDYDRSTDKENNEVVFKGQLTFEDLQKEPSFEWFKEGATNYTPDKEAIAYLKKELPEYEVIVFLGTWCDDSHVEVPRLYKILTTANYPMRKYSLYGVDRAKTSKYVENKLYKIEQVPTIILVRKNNEAGRIVEHPKKSIEQDLVEIIKRDKSR